MLQESADGHNQWADFGSFDFSQVQQNAQNSSLIFPELESSTADGTSEAGSKVHGDVFNLDQDLRDSEYLDRLQALEKEQDVLNNSLISLTTHFAQVQFRLKQISTCTTEDPKTKERLIKELERFASEGCPEIQSSMQAFSHSGCDDANILNEVPSTQPGETRTLIQRLQKQLSEVERYAYESGQSDLPSMVLLEKQRLVLEALQQKIKLDIEGNEHHPPEHLRAKVDEALDAILSPYKKKAEDRDETVLHLQAFVEDLERYIGHLQNVNAESNGMSRTKSSQDPDVKAPPGSPPLEGRPSSAAAVHRTRSVIESIPIVNLCVRQSRFKQNALKTTTKGNHWGDLRALLEVAISSVIELAQKRPSEQGTASKAKYLSSQQQSQNLTRAVRKKLTPALFDIMRHGLLNVTDGGGRSILCAARKAETVEINPWDLIMRYYEYKKGDQYRSSTTRRLADTFQLSTGERKITAVESLLGTIGDILDSHQKFKPEPLTYMKAFVCAALNKKCLSSWLRMIYCTKYITDEYYAPWSYANKTHFDDTCYSLEKLNQFDFKLPVDAAIRPFSNLDDAF